MGPSIPLRLIRGDLALVAGGAAGDSEKTRPPTAAMIAQLRALAGLYRSGCRRLTVAEIDGHPADPAAADTGVFGFFAVLLRSRGLEPMAVRRARAGSTPARLLADHAAETMRLSARRGLARALTDGAAGAATDADALIALQETGAGDTGVAFAAVPRIDPVLCSGCDACLAVCPGDVLTRIKDKTGKSFYAADCASCDGCGLCVEVCASSAIMIEHMTRAPSMIALRHWNCAACGVPVHVPQARAEIDDGLCDICRHSGHHKKLFQVLP